MKRKVDGNELLYHFFQKAWLEDEPEAARSFIKKAIDTLGVWMHPSYYRELPIIVPYAVRDLTCRSSGPDGADEWGSPNADGYFRDDNSLIKGIVTSLEIESPTRWLKGLKGNGFTASHVWREPADYAHTNKLASSRPNLNSFVPNLVWLPKQIAKLTDREGSFAQHYLQVLSRHIYEHCPVNPNLENLVSRCWRELPSPIDVSDVQLPACEDMSFFEYKASMVARRKNGKIAVVRDACLEIARTGRLSNRKLISTRYTDGLLEVRPVKLKALAKWLGGCI